MRTTHSILALCAIFAHDVCAQSIRPRLERDLAIPSNPSGVSPACDRAVMLKGMTYLIAGDASTGHELMQWDPVRRRATLVRDVRPGPQGSAMQDLISHAGRLWFLADDGMRGKQLWTSDRTTAGTRIVVDLGRSLNPGFLRACGPTRVVCAATSPSAGRELLSSDGTANGTRFVDIEMGSAGSSPRDLYADASNSRCFFLATTSAAGREVWVTDGTRAGTRLVAESVPSRGGLAGGGYFNASASKVFYSEGRQLFALDLAAKSSTRIVNSTHYFFTSVVVGGQVYFQNTASPGGVWRSDGTVAGTRYFANIGPVNFGLVRRFVRGPGMTFAWAAEVGRSTAYVVFATPSGVTATQTWTAAQPVEFLGKDLYCLASRVDDPYALPELWAPDGAAARRIEPQAWNYRPVFSRGLTPLSATSALMVGGDQLRGRELFEIAGGRLQLLRDFWRVPNRPVSSEIASIVSLKRGLLFLAKDGLSRHRLETILRHDGLANGRLTHLDVPRNSTFPVRFSSMCSLDEYAFFLGGKDFGRRLCGAATVRGVAPDCFSSPVFGKGRTTSLRLRTGSSCILAARSTSAMARVPGRASSRRAAFRPSPSPSSRSSAARASHSPRRRQRLVASSGSPTARTRARSASSIFAQVRATAC